MVGQDDIDYKKQREMSEKQSKLTLQQDYARPWNSQKLSEMTIITLPATFSRLKG